MQTWLPGHVTHRRSQHNIYSTEAVVRDSSEQRLVAVQGAQPPRKNTGMNTTSESQRSSRLATLPWVSEATPKEETEPSMPPGVRKKTPDQ
jgi:hypothetical protein